MSSPSSPRRIESKYNPVNGKNLVPFTLLPPFNRCKVNQLPKSSDFYRLCKVSKMISCNGSTSTVLLQNLASSGYSIGKIYDCSEMNTKNKLILSKQRLAKCWTEYQVITNCGLSEYLGIYYDADNLSLIIHQQAYSVTLSQYVLRRASVTESECRKISRQILVSLWRLHNAQYVHSDIKPANVMYRELDDLYESNCIQDGWHMIDFNEIHKNRAMDCYVGTMGWSAPEIEYNAQQNKNKYTYSSDIFSFGLIILYILFGSQPFQVPNGERAKYKINTDDDQLTILKKRVLRKQILTNWYYGVVANSESMMKKYLFSIYQSKQISNDLYKLLSDGILNYDPNKRMSCKQIYNSKWFQSD